MAKKTKKTKKVKVAHLGEAHIQATFNNIIINRGNIRYRRISLNS